MSAEVPMRVMLHACCGPCLLEPYDALAAGHEVVVCYANPNIHPAEEYERRRDTLAAYAEGAGIPVIELAYDPALWEAAVAGVREDPSRRCRRCFALRIGMVADEARRNGFDAVATTLTVSPYQDPAAIREAGEEACAVAGVEFMITDFREQYPEATRRSRELGMYRQRYCGCEPSIREAEEDRRHRREARRRG
jgi:predicted adenine nucleotide alpha hydrolase (AANH) superfamily ATPase